MGHLLGDPSPPADLLWAKTTFWILQKQRYEYFWKLSIQNEVVMVAVVQSLSHVQLLQPHGL